MKSKKPAAITINLLPKDPFFDSVIGKTFKWALTDGRYIVIFTELVVILSFVARFTLDRQLTDINDQIVSNEAAIESFGEFEKDFRNAQEKISYIDQLNEESNLVDVFAYISEVTPRGIEVDELRILPESVTIAGTTTSQNNLNLLINNLQLSPHFFDVKVDKITNQEDGRPGYLFSMQARTKPAVTVTKK